jgi:hypothetical protein
MLFVTFCVVLVVRATAGLSLHGQTRLDENGRILKRFEDVAKLLKSSESTLKRPSVNNNTCVDTYD